MFCLSGSFVGRVGQLGALGEGNRFRKGMNSHCWKMEAMHGDGRTSESDTASTMVFGFVELEAFG